MKKRSLLIVIATSLVTAHAISQTAYQPSAEAERAAKSMRTAELAGHIRFLSDDLLEGRLPGSRGDRLAQAYIAAQFEAIGLQPIGEDKSYFQPFELVGVKTHAPAQLTFTHQSKKLDAKLSDDFMAVAGAQKSPIKVRDAEVVFVGYGIQAPEYQWDDYKGKSLAGKVLLFMNNDPAKDPELFAGETRLYYGRWTYKYEMAARMNAAGAIIIHTKESAGYPWQVVQSSWGGEQFALPYESGATVALQSWVTEKTAKKLVEMSGFNLDKLRAQAETPDFQPVPLGVNLSVEFAADLRRVTTANVIGVLPGTAPERSKEYVVYSAHHDHLGINEAAKPKEDRIYNGAVDNASGVGGLLTLARAFNALNPRPARSLMFAAVAAEEQGLLGSKYLATHPPVPPGRMAANINMDCLSILGKARDITQIGRGKSTLDKWVDTIAAKQRRVVKPDQFPDRGFFYRSDQFNFAKIGVPAVTFDAGIDIVGKPSEWGKEQSEKWESLYYHQVSDEISDDWDLAGAMQDLELNFHLGYAIAQAMELPKWRAGDEFEAVRKQALDDLPKNP